MLRNSSSFGVSFVLVALGCSAESAESSNPGGSPPDANGGSTTVNTGGATSSSSGGSTAAATGGSVSTSNGGSTAVTTGGSVSTSNGGSSSGVGAAPTGGATDGGSSTSSGGAATAGGAGVPTASGGSAAGASATGCADGCAELSVPFTQYTTSTTTTDSSGVMTTTNTYYSQQFEIYIGDDMTGVDLTGGTITVRIRKVAGKAGGLQIFAKGVMSNDYASAYSDPWFGIDADLTTDWKDITLDLAAPGHKDDTFSAATVHILAIQMSSGDAWYLDDAKTMVDQTALVNPTVVQIDGVSVTGVASAPGPFAFTDDVSEFHLGTYQPIEGSTVTWIGP